MVGGMTAPVKEPLLKTIKSTLRIHFTGIRCKEVAVKDHRVFITLPKIMFDTPDESIAQYVLLVLQGGKMYSNVNNITIDEESIAIEMPELAVAQCSTQEKK